MSNEKSPKANGLATDPLQRLASFKPPRDLSLGGAKPNKKVFTPNLNVTRTKNKGPAPANPKEQKKDEKQRRDNKFDKSKNKRNGPNIIKSTGVFAEGFASAERRSSRFSYGSRDTDSAPVLQKPTLRVKDMVKIDKALEEEKIRSVMGDSGNPEDDVCEDFRTMYERDAPIKLPMDDGGWSKVKPRVKQEVVIKSEPTEDYACEAVATRPIAEVKAEVFENTDVVKLLRTDEPTLLLLQLPDSLPGRGGSVDDEAPRRKQRGNEEPSTSAGEGGEEKPVDTRCYMKDLEEGRIGKLRVHRSGRVSLALGDSIFEVSMGTKAAFHQEVVSVAVDDPSRSANLVALGALQHKLNLLPDWEEMFKDITV